MFVPRLATIGQCLMAFGAALVLPELVFAAILLWNYASSERSRDEEEGLDTALRIMAAVDRELVGIQAAAQALATSSSLLQGDYEAFHGQALMTLQSWSQERPEDYAIVVRDRAGRQVFNTRLPWGSPLPHGAALSTNLEVIETDAGLIGRREQFEPLPEVPRQFGQRHEPGEGHDVLVLGLGGALDRGEDLEELGASHGLSSVSGEGALLFGVEPKESESGAHELGPGSLGALGLLEVGLSYSGFYDGRAVE